MFRAATTPRLAGRRISRARGVAATIASSVPALPSVEPSSTTRISWSGSVWLASVASASPIRNVALKVGTMAEKVGGEAARLEVVDKVPAAAPMHGDADGDRDRRHHE